MENEIKSRVGTNALARRFFVYKMKKLKKRLIFRKKRSYATKT